MKNMNYNEEKQENCKEEINHGCSCGSCHDHEHDHSCCEEHGHEHGHDCCEDHEHHHDHDCEEHGYDTLTMILEDNSELECPIIEVFEIGEQSYIALLHPVTEKVLLYRFSDYEDDTIDIELIEDDEEFKLVAETFRSLQDEE